MELWFLNWLRPRLPAAHAVQAAARLAVWFSGGILLMAGMRMTSAAFTGFGPTRWPALWVGGLVFIGVELTVHLLLLLRGRPNFFSGSA